LCVSTLEFTYTFKALVPLIMAAASRVARSSKFISGLSAFPITPHSESGVVDCDALAALVQRLVAANVDSIGLLGSTGSYAYLERTERRRAIDVAVEVTKKHHSSGPSLSTEPPLLLVGIGHVRTSAVIELAKDAKEAGADAGLLAPVSYLPLTDNEVFAHFVSVAQAVPDLPLVIYNNPGTTNFSFSHALIKRLSALPSVVGLKNPASGDEARVLVEKHTALQQAVAAHRAGDFSIGSSVDWFAAESMLAGSQAWFSVAGGLFPAPCMAIVSAVQRGDVTEARRLDAELADLWALFIELTSFRVVYAAAKLMGLCTCDPPLPVLPLNEEQTARVSEVLLRLGLMTEKSP
jgi:4-hydroxy-tetrahydrodipicolinate synthase